MIGSDVLSACRETLHVVLEKTPDEEALLRALDRLLAAWHDAPDAEPDASDREPPRADADLRATLERRWPNFGLYATADPFSDDWVSLTGDAIDDLLDIAGDLGEAVWRSENVSPADGLWYLHLMHFHWGRHARDLASYLHARRYEDERRQE